MLSPATVLLRQILTPANDRPLSARTWQANKPRSTLPFLYLPKRLMHHPDVGNTLDTAANPLSPSTGETDRNDVGKFPPD